MRGPVHVQRRLGRRAVGEDGSIQVSPIGRWTPFECEAGDRTSSRRPQAWWVAAANQPICRRYGEFSIAAESGPKGLAMAAIRR
jgi:hypothetical protein